MEIIDNQYTKESGKNGLQVTRDMKTNWVSTSKWAMFLAILGFIYTALMLVVVTVMMPMMRMALAMTGQSELAGLMESAGIAFMIFMLLILVVMFLIHFFHIRFATGIQRAVQYESQETFEAAWRNLRNHFRLNGIVVIAMIAVYVVALIYLGSMAASRADF